MGIWICLTVVGLVLLVDLFCLQSDLLAWRNARRHRYSLEDLQFATGIERRAELEAIVGAPGPDWLYHVAPETWARLPREAWWWRISDWLLLPSLLTCGACVGLTLRAGEAHWLTFGLGLTLFLTSIVVAFLHVARREFEDLGDEPDYWDEAEEERRGLIATCRHLGENLDQELAIRKANRQRYREHAGLTWFERILFCAGERWLEGKFRRGRVEVAHALETSEALERELWVHREAARRGLRNATDPEWASLLCQIELQANEGLDAAVGTDRSEADDPFRDHDPDDPYGVNTPYDPDDPLS